jgi:DNA-binding XRE family transcriptional regulator
LGQALRQGRLEAGLSQERAAAVLAVDATTVSRYERDRVKEPDLGLVGRAIAHYPPERAGDILGAALGRAMTEVLQGFRGKEKSRG